MKKNPPAETVLAFVCVGIICFFLFDRVECLYAALTIGGLGLLSKRFSQALHSMWAWVSEKVGKVMSTLILGLLFFLILSPISLLYRFFSKNNPFQKGAQESSTFVTRNYQFSKEDLKNPW